MRHGQRPKHFIRLPRGQALRVTFGLVLFMIVVAIYAPHLAYNISTEAVFNARIIPIVSPIEGIVTKPPPADGSVVRAGAVLAEIENRAADRRHLQQLRAEAAGLQERIAAHNQLLQDLDRIRQTMEVRREAYQASSVERLEILLKQAQADVTAAAARARELRRNRDRKFRMSGSAGLSESELDEAKINAVISQAEAERARLEVDMIGAELNSLRHGIYVAEERNDVPYTEQRIDELRVRQAEVRAALREHITRLRGIENSIVVEEDRLKELASVRLVAPRDGVVWRPRVVHGSRVGANSEILRLIDCADIFVSAKLHQRHFEDLHLGDSVLVRLIGDQNLQKAWVRDLRGMGGSDVGDRFAAPIPPIRNDEFLVTLQLNAQPGWGRASDYCNVGRKAEVRFDRDLGWFGNVIVQVTDIFTRSLAALGSRDGDRIVPSSSPASGRDRHNRAALLAQD